MGPFSGKRELDNVTSRRVGAQQGGSAIGGGIKGGDGRAAQQQRDPHSGDPLGHQLAIYPSACGEGAAAGRQGLGDSHGSRVGNCHPLLLHAST